jgi:ribonuclease HII
MSEDEKETIISETSEKKVRKPRVKAEPLLKCYLENPNVSEIGVDEVGRGPLLGRVYTAAVILPKDDSFDHSKMKDSKKFHSKQKIQEVAEYIKENAIAWSVSYEDEKTIDEINILQATQKCMHKCIAEVLKNGSRKPHQIQLLIDGNYFNSYTEYNHSKKKFDALNHVCVEGGDNKYSCIAAASILAKVARDAYIEELCAENPELSERYNIDSNKGYGAKKHLDGIKEHGITKWHRKTFGICKVSKMATPFHIDLKIET